MKRKSVVLQVPGRVTRSTVQKATGNADNDVRLKSCDKEVPERLSKRMRRPTCSTVLEKAQNISGSQELENNAFVQIME